MNKPQQELRVFKVRRRWVDGTIFVGLFILNEHPMQEFWHRLYPDEYVIASERIGIVVDGRVQ